MQRDGSVQEVDRHSCILLRVVTERLSNVSILQQRPEGSKEAGQTKYLGTEPFKTENVKTEAGELCLLQV